MCMMESLENAAQVAEKMVKKNAEEMVEEIAEAQAAEAEAEAEEMADAEDSDFEACWADFFAMLRKAEDEGTLDEFFESIYQ